MERREYLGRIKVYAIAKASGNQHDLERVKVIWRGRESSLPCFPEAYKISYQPNGTPRHTAILIDCAAPKTVYEVRLEEVEEAAHGGKM